MAGTIQGVGLGLRWAFLEEVAAGSAPAGIDFFECSPENYMRRGGYFPAALERVAERHPLSSHGLALDVGGEDPLDPEYLRTLRELLDRLEIPRHSDHLCWSRAAGNHLHDLLPLPTSEAVVRHVADRVQRVQDALRRPLALENISYYLPPTGGGLAEAEFVAAVVNRADCGLLLDINNVLVNATNHGFEARAYLDRLPLERIQQLHVAGGERLEGFDDLVIDTHGTDPKDAVLDLMAYVLERTGPIPVLYERDHDIPPLAELGRQVAEIRGVWDRAVARWREREPTAAGPPAVVDVGPSTRSPDPRADLGRYVLDLAPREAATLRGVPSPRLQVYRRLVRGTVQRTLSTFLPRTRAHLGAASFERWAAQWLADEGPRSRYLRDLPVEFVEWARARWSADPGVPAWIPDLARHELLEAEVEDEVDAPLPVGAAGFELDRGLMFARSVRLVSYTARVHELPEEGGGCPALGDLWLLAHRDRDGDAAYLELSVLAAGLVGSLQAGRSVREAVTAACHGASLPCDDEALARLAAVLTELADRGLVTPTPDEHRPS